MKPGGTSQNEVYTDGFLHNVYLSCFEKVREVVIWSGQWSVFVFYGDSADKDKDSAEGKVWVDISTGF